MTERLRVLYAEDNPHDIDLTRMRFQSESDTMSLEIVGTGEECLSRIQANTVDVLLLDNHLPDMDGMDVLRAITATGAKLPVVMVTSVGDESVVVAALRLGAVNYVPKTHEYLTSLPATLRSAVVEYRRNQLLGGRSFDHPRRILYVEHLAMDVDLTIQHLAESAPHFSVEAVSSCQDALVRVAERDPFDLVLMDLRMPDMNALEFVREAKRRGLTLPPFIIITGNGDDSTAIAALRLGATDYIAKHDGYLDHLAHTIDHAIDFDRMEKLNAQLRAELLARRRAEDELRMTQEQLLQSQKIESIGRLAGGVAHDFNNLLTVIIGTAELAAESLPADHPVREDIQEILHTGERAAAITRQLLAFSRRQILQPETLDLNVVVLDMGKMLNRLIGEQITITYRLASDLAPVRVDRAQIAQVILNLAVNARDAMPTGGTLTTETANVDLDEEYVRTHTSVEPGPYVMLAVSDTGIGMDKNIQAQMYEPFFSTKSEDYGTGLGLATVYGIVKQSGGSIWVYSEVGKGTTFRIYLPRTNDRAVTAKAQAPAAMSPGHETILVVEDDDALRNIALRILRIAGYTVLGAASGADALALFEKHTTPIDLLLTDVVLPGMNGPTLATQLAALQPSIKVLFSSGYTDDAIVRHGVLDASIAFIGKPYTVAELTRKVRSVLDTPATHA